MVITGEITKEGTTYAAMVEPLAAYAEGRSRSAACEALAEAIRELAAGFGPLQGFRVEVRDDGEETLYVTASDPARLVSMLLRRQRDLHGLSLADVAGKLGTKSRNSYAQYEQGQRAPSSAVLQQLLDAVAPELVLAVIPRTARVIPRWDEDLEPEVREALDHLLENPTPEAAQALKALGGGRGAKPKKAARG